jgi:hypothetical protein
MTTTVADYLLQRFRGWEVEQVSAIPVTGSSRRRWAEQWADPPPAVASLHNERPHPVTWELRAMEDSPKFAESQSLRGTKEIDS